MSWVDIFFSFRGRINRKVYWLGCLALTVAAQCLIGLLSYLATGHVLAPAVWDRSADNVGLWLPVWIAYSALLFWPAGALTIKRLHDRGHSSLIWYIYFAASRGSDAYPPPEAPPAQT